MSFSLQCNIEEIQDPTYSCVILEINTAMYFLCYLEALQLDRIHSFKLEDHDHSMMISKNSSSTIQLAIPDIGYSALITEENFELFKCFCVDCILNLFESTHEDFELPDCELTF